MAEIQDKIVTVESLKALHDYNKETYETKANVADLSENVSGLSESVTNLSNTKFDKPDNDIVPIANGGTNSSNGATGLANLFAEGATVLSSYQYGDTLPEAGTVGRIFFKKLSE